MGIRYRIHHIYGMSHYVILYGDVRMKKSAFAMIVALCVCGATEAMAQDSIAVMKLDASGPEQEAQSAMLLESLRSEVTKTNRTLDANGSDVTYAEMQMLTGCDREASIACYEAACETLGSSAIIFGNVGENGQTSLVWYVSGKGIFREVSGVVTDQETADTLAQRMVVGEKGSLIVTSNVPGADVFIDGKRVGMSAEFVENAQPLTLVAGNYIVSVRKEGYQREDAVKVTVVGNEQAHIHIDLVVALDENKIKNVMKYSGWGALGVGAAGMIGAFIVEGLMGSTQDTMDNGIKKGNDDKDFTNLNNKGNKLWTTKTALYVVGGVGLAAGVTMLCLGYFYNFESDQALADTRIPEINIAASPEFSGLNFGWTF